MANTSSKIARVVAVLISTVIGCVIGNVLIWFVNSNLTDDVIRWVFIILGIVVMITTLPTLISSAKHVKEKLGWLSLLLSIVSMGLGFVMCFNQEYMPYIVGAYLIVFPIIRIILAKDTFAQTRREAPLLILGVLVLLLGFHSVTNTIFLVGGWVIFVLSLIYGVLGLINALKD